MVVYFWFTNHLILALATLILFGVVYLSKFGANKVVVIIFGALGFVNTFVGYRYISMIDTVSGNQRLGARDVNLVADIKMWSAALSVLGLVVIFAAYRKYKSA